MFSINILVVVEMFSNILSRIEGEGRIDIVIDKDSFKVKINFTEPQRFFEKILYGIDVDYGVDIVSRICGLCGVSHIYAYVKSFEKNIEIPEEVEDYRKVLLSIERIKSHLIHTCFLYLPDILNVESINDLFIKYSDLARTCSKLYNFVYKLANCFEYRLHNVINIKLGGVYHYPDKERISRSTDILNDFKSNLRELIRIIYKHRDLFSEKHYFKTLVSLDKEYPFYSDRVIYGNEVISVDKYESKLIDISREDSNGSRYCLYDRELYLTGPLARLNNYMYYVRDIIDEYLSEYCLNNVFQNIYASIIGRIVEIIYSINYIEKFVDRFRKPSINYVKIRLEDNLYNIFVEAPRGVLYHSYLVEKNRIINSRIITPTQLNVYAMENMPIHYIRKQSDLNINRIKMIIRSLDPCLSCAVHIIKLSD